MWCGAPVGVVAGALSPAAVERFAAYASLGGRVFVDSGAFSVRSKGGTVDFDAILETYGELGRRTVRAQLIEVVAPDMVGDQVATLNLLRFYRRRLAHLHRLGLTILVPLQKGELRGQALLDAARAAAGVPFTPAVPYCLDAWTESDVLEFCRETGVERIHLLGGGARKIAAVASELPGVTVQGDACRHRAWVGSGRRAWKMMAEELDLSFNPDGTRSDWDAVADGEDMADVRALERDVRHEALWWLAIRDGLGSLAAARRFAPDRLRRLIGATDAAS